MALVNLEKVTASLGAKAVLWELFSFNPPSLKLYVDLCAWSQFLSEILDQQPRHDRRAARQPGAQPAAHRLTSCARSWPSCAAARPISSRSCTASRTRNCCASASATSSARTPEAETAAALSDLAETILVQIAEIEAVAADRRDFGEPRSADGRPGNWTCGARPWQAWRPRAELSQRSGPDPGLRRRACRW